MNKDKRDSTELNKGKLYNKKCYRLYKNWRRLINIMSINLKLKPDKFSSGRKHKCGQIIIETKAILDNKSKV